MTRLRVAATLMVLSAAGCATNDAPGVEPTKPAPAIQFVTVDLSTGVGTVSIRIDDSGDAPAIGVLNAIAAQVRVSTWPGDVEVPSVDIVGRFPAAQLPDGAQQVGYGQIERQLDATLDGKAWYAISLPERPADYRFLGALFAFDGGTRGVRVSPAHPPVVASVRSCPKTAGVVAVYAHFSEPVTKGAGALALAYGAAAADCPIGGDTPAETQFICMDATGGQTFSLRIVDTVVAQESGAPMAVGTLRSADMQASMTADGCSFYKPVIVEATLSSASR